MTTNNTETTMFLNCLMGLRNQSNEFMKKVESGEIVCEEEYNVEE